MKKIKLDLIKHGVKVGDICGPIQPNVTEDCYFEAEGEIIGFYLKDIGACNPRMAEVAALADFEFRSDRVPKSEMRRSSGLFSKENEVKQYSTILGYCAPKPHMRRNYATMSSVHSHASARTFLKAMLMLCRMGEDLIRDLAPGIYEQQRAIIAREVPQKWRFSELFTSSISNFNIAAPYHRDTANLPGCVNIIIAKKKDAEGGHTTVPDYGATVNSCDNSMLVYPAWRNVHGVTPIEVLRPGGYRNSLVFYPLRVV